MLTILKFLIFGHVHKWETVETKVLEYKKRKGHLDRGSRVILKCSICGDYKHKDII